ncbi:MAG: DUF1569 domain-containing protein [Acidobacteriaceae bacterium]
MTVKHLFDPKLAEEVKRRVMSIQPDNARQWGSMDPAQAFAHCTRGLQMAMGVINPKRASFPANIVGLLIKPLVFGDDKPMRQNSPSSPELFPARSMACNFECERTQLIATIDSFATQGAGCCSQHPHPFFGRLEPQQWAILMYKHLDHHLRQFNG